MTKEEQGKEEKNFQTVKRIDKLPIDVRIKLEKRNIFDGLVLFSGTENSPRDIVKEEQSLKLPSQLLEESFGK